MVPWSCSIVAATVVACWVTCANFRHLSWIPGHCEAGMVIRRTIEAASNDSAPRRLSPLVETIPVCGPGLARQSPAAGCRSGSRTSDSRCGRGARPRIVVPDEGKQLSEAGFRSGALASNGLRSFRNRAGEARETFVECVGHRSREARHRLAGGARRGYHWAPYGVGPWGRTVSCGGFDRGAGLFLLEAVGAQVSKSRV